VTYGQEGSERLSVSVSMGFGGSSPTGAVSIKRVTTTLCTIKLSLGKGWCGLSASRLNAGTYHLLAIYGGSTTLRGSVSRQKTLSVVKDTARTTLELSTANVTYGLEGTERLSVTVSPGFGGFGPTGWSRSAALLA